MEIRERPPPLSEMSMAGPLGGNAGRSGAPTTCVKDMNGGPQVPVWDPIPIQDPKSVL
jgi:hypothetical protein